MDKLAIVLRAAWAGLRTKKARKAESALIAVVVAEVLKALGLT